MNYNYLYLHGFASGPQSTKARYLRDRFQEQGSNLIIPDLNQDDFSHLTLTRQLQQVEQILQAKPEPFVVLGSSFGGLTAAWLAERQSQAQQIMLLAPAFQFLEHWLPQLGEAQVQQWRQKGVLSVYHYAVQQWLPLNYQFIEDLQTYREQQLQRPVPTLILHGRRDEIIPIKASQTFAAQRPWVSLVELDGDHTLGDILPEIWSRLSQCLSN